MYLEDEHWYNTKGMLFLTNSSFYRKTGIARPQISRGRVVEKYDHKFVTPISYFLE